MMISEELKKDIYGVISTFEDEELDELLGYIKAEKEDRKQQLLGCAKLAFKDFLLELENDYGVCIVHDGWELGLHNVTFDFIKDDE